MERSEAERQRPSESKLEAMQVARDFVAKGALSMIDWANNKPVNRGKKPKVGGHQASSTSLATVLTALYFKVLQPQDRVAVSTWRHPYHDHRASICASLSHRPTHPYSHR